MPGEVRQYLETHGVAVTHRSASGELICRCPWCPPDPAKEPALKVREDNWYYHCWRCQAKGGEFGLKQAFGDMTVAASYVVPFKPVWTGKATRPLPKPTDALEATVARAEAALRTSAGKVAWDYLIGRGFTEETILRFRLGVEPIYRFPDGVTAQALVIPYLQDGKPALLKLRSITAADTKKSIARDPSGVGHPLYNTDALKNVGGIVYVTEGELDAVSLEQYGFGPAVSVSNGAEYWDEAWAAQLVDFATVAAFYDDDDAGKKGFEKCAAAIGAYRVIRVTIPGAKDANAALRAGVPAETIRQALAAAESPMRGLVMSFSEALKSAKDDVDKKTLGSTGYERFDKALGGGLRPAEVSVVCGDGGSGKTTLLEDVIRRQSIAGRACLFGSFENTPESIAEDMEVAYLAGPPHGHAAVYEALERNLRFIRTNGKMPIEVLRDVILFTVRRFGTQVVVLDNLHKFLPYDSTNERHEIDRACDAIDDIAKRYKIHIFLVVHFRKRASGGGSDRSLDDLLGSAGPGRIAHNVFHVQHVPDSNLTRLKFLKSRSKRSVQDSKLLFEYTPQTRTFRDIDNRPEDSKGANRFAKPRAYSENEHD